MHDIHWMDNKREKKLTNFLEFSKKPKKDDIAVITATVADSGTALFVNELSVLETKIFMSLRDLEV